MRKFDRSANLNLLEASHRTDQTPPPTTLNFFVRFLVLPSSSSSYLSPSPSSSPPPSLRPVTMTPGSFTRHHGTRPSPPFQMIFSYNQLQRFSDELGKWRVTTEPLEQQPNITPNPRSTTSHSLRPALI